MENGLCEWARTYQQDVLNLRMKKLGRNHPHTIQAQRSLAESNLTLFDMGPCLLAQNHIRKTHWWTRPSFADWKPWLILKPEHVPYCTTLSDLTFSLWCAGRLALSKQFGERAVKGLIKRLGSDDPLTLTAMFNLARTYHHLCDERASRALLIEVLRKRKHFFGLNHLDTLITRSELAMSFCIAEERLGIAERILLNVVATKKKVLGEEHMYTLVDESPR